MKLNKVVKYQSYLNNAIAISILSEDARTSILDIDLLGCANTIHNS